MHCEGVKSVALLRGVTPAKTEHSTSPLGLVRKLPGSETVLTAHPQCTNKNSENIFKLTQHPHHFPQGHFVTGISNNETDLCTAVPSQSYSSSQAQSH